jgi:ribosomal protein L31
VDSGQIHVVWYDSTPGNYEIFYKRSTNGGETWGSVKRLTWNKDASSYPAIAVDSSNTIHTIWHDYTPGNWEIYYKRSTDGGVSWGKIRRLTWSSNESCRPAIAIDSSDNIHAVWYDASVGDDKIYYKRSTNGGVTWDSTKRLTWNAANSNTPAIAVDSSNGIHLSWIDYTPGNAEIFYKRSTNNGVTWESTKRLTWNTGNSVSPAIAVDLSDTIHIFWQDKTPGNYEIYYKIGGQ